MALIILSILNWLLIAIVGLVFVLFMIWAVTGYASKVPFVPVPNSVLAPLYTALDVTEDSILYDLGSGDGRVLFYISKRVPNARYIGIENGPFPLILAHVRAWWHRKYTDTNIEIMNQDFFDRDLSDATHIFTYLYPNVMDDLLPKLEKELNPGTRLVSVSFQFTQKRPVAEQELPLSKYTLKRKLYVYEF